MARKESYRHKNSAKISTESLPREVIPVDPAIKQQYEDGRMILIDKALHWTSFDVVRKIRSMLRIKKVGHAGTLDPLATGLLVVCTGTFTKKINEYMAAEKEYTGTFTLGAVTSTYDLESEPEQQKDFLTITPEHIRNTTQQFIGTIDQLPPMYSALKKEGTPLYELARKGVAVKLEPRKITITTFEITDIQLPIVSFKISCSTGTYIRSIANDFGAALGCGAYLSSLRRTRIGTLLVDDAVTMEQFIESIKAS